MTMRVYKFPVQITDEFSVELPTGFRFLSVHTQRGAPFMWCLVDDQARRVSHRFRVVGAGHPCDHLIGDGGFRWSFCGTFLVENDSLVFHLFREVDSDAAPCAVG